MLSQLLGHRSPPLSPVNSQDYITATSLSPVLCDPCYSAYTSTSTFMSWWESPPRHRRESVCVMCGRRGGCCLMGMKELCLPLYNPVRALVTRRHEVKHIILTWHRWRNQIKPVHCRAVSGEKTLEGKSTAFSQARTNLTGQLDCWGFRSEDPFTKCNSDSSFTRKWGWTIPLNEMSFFRTTNNLTKLDDKLFCLLPFEKKIKVCFKRVIVSACLTYLIALLEAVLYLSIHRTVSNSRERN